jgi:hypothetical protein
MELFLSKLSISHNLDGEVVLSDWRKHEEEHTKYNKMKKPELVELCKAGGFKSTGTKPELIGFIFNEVAEVAKVEKVAKVKAEKPVKIKKESPQPVAKKSILEKMSTSAPVVSINRNSHGNLEHTDSGFVFDKKTKKVIGKQEGEEVVPITKDDIDTCNKYRFHYEIPESLGIGDEVDEEIEAIDELDEGALVDAGGDEEDDSDDEIEY